MAPYSFKSFFHLANLGSMLIGLFPFFRTVPPVASIGPIHSSKVHADGNSLPRRNHHD